MSDPVLLSDIGDDKSIWQYENETGKKYLVFKRKIESGQSLCLAVDEEQYYQKLISDIHIGTNGYVVIKNSSGRIVMHPDLDYTSLEKMIEDQCAGKTGLSEYYSYWWTDSDLPRVKKISAYAPAQAGDDFWVISAVVDYDDFYIPIVEGLKKIGGIFGLGLVILLGMIFLIAKLLSDQKKPQKRLYIYGN